MAGGVATGPEIYVLLTKDSLARSLEDIDTDIANLLGYLERMRDEGLVRHIIFIGNVNAPITRNTFSGDSYAHKRTEELLKSQRSVFVGKLQVSERKETAEAFKKLKHRYLDINYEFYRLPEPVLEKH